MKDEEYDPRLNLLGRQESGGLLDFSKITFDHSVSMNYVSGSNNSSMMGEYVCGLNYRIAEPLSLKMEIGAFNIPYSSYNLPDSKEGDVYLKSATLDYRPNDKMRFKVEFRDFRNDYYNYYDPFGRRGSFWGNGFDKNFADD